MSLPRLALAVIGDEIGPSLPEMLSFCAENDVRRLDMRTVDGRNLLGMTLDEVTISPAAAECRHHGADLRLARAEMARPRQGAGRRQGRLRLRSGNCPADDPLAHAFDVAAVLGASKIRMFSYLRYPASSPTTSPLRSLPAARSRRALRHHARDGERAGLQHRFDRRARRLLRREASRDTVETVAAICGRWSTSATAGRWASRRPTTTSPRSRRWST